MTDLLVLRHAQAAPEGDDFDRLLTERGVGDARTVASRWGVLPLPDRILCSPARRTRDTLGLLFAAGLDPRRVEYHDSLYQASAEHWLKWVWAAPQSRRVLMLVGHNPGVSELVTGLGDQTRASTLAPATLVHLQGPDTWQDWRLGSARIAELLTP